MISRLLSVCCILYMFLVKNLSGIFPKAERTCAFWYYFRAGGDERHVYLYMEETTWPVPGGHLIGHYCAVRLKEAKKSKASIGSDVRWWAQSSSAIKWFFFNWRFSYMMFSNAKMMLGRLFDMKTIKVRNWRKWRRNQISFVIFPGGARYRRNPRGVAELRWGWRGGRYIHVYNLPLHLRVSPLVRACNASPLRGNCGIVLVITEASPWFV